MSHVWQTGNILKMPLYLALRALDEIDAHVKSGQPTDPQLEKMLVNATDWSDLHVFQRAFSIIEQLPDKGPFISTLLKYALDHTQMNLAACAYKGMCHAKDLSPFYQAIEKGVLCPNMPIASSAIYPVVTEVAARKFIAPQLHLAIIAATDHPAGFVVSRALEAIMYLPDKRPFVPVLLKLSSDHARSWIAMNAYRAMCHAKDLSPFHKVIEQGSLSPDSGIAREAMLPILEQAQITGVIDSELQISVINAMDHPHHLTVICGLDVIKHLSDKRAFIPALQKCLNNPRPQLAQTAAELLKDAQNVPFSVQRNSPAISIKNVRLDFNIDANGGGPAAHRNDAITLLSDTFYKSIANGNVSAKAKIFYDPSQSLSEHDIIDVTFPADDRDDILKWSANGVAPEFDLQGIGVAYVVTLKERLSL